MTIAAKKLREDDAVIADVAEAVGYGNPVAFSKAFTRLQGWGRDVFAGRSGRCGTLNWLKCELVKIATGHRRSRNDERVFTRIRLRSLPRRRGRTREGMLTDSEFRRTSALASLRTRSFSRLLQLLRFPLRTLQPLGTFRSRASSSLFRGTFGAPGPNPLSCPPLPPLIDTS